MALVAGSAGAATDGGSAEAERFVAALAREIVETYQEQPSPEAARAQFSAIFERSVDIGGMAAAVLGRKWPAATPAEQARFAELLRERAVANLEARLAADRDERVCVSDAEALGEARYFVRGHVCDGEDRTLGWFVVRQGDGFRVRDFIVEGSSFVALAREEYASVLARSGGSVAALIQEMERAGKR